MSRHADALRRVERGYGTGEPPEDYLEGFGAFLRENINQIPALVVVTQRPRELTRAQLNQKVPPEFLRSKLPERVKRHCPRVVKKQRSKYPPKKMKPNPELRKKLHRESLW